MSDQTVSISKKCLTESLRRILWRHMLEYYIQMQGLVVGKLEDNELAETTLIAERPANFIEGRVSAVVKKFIKTADWQLKSNLNERYLRITMGEKEFLDSEKRISAWNVAAGVLTVGFEELVNRLSFNVRDYLVTETIATREREIVKILEKLEAKRDNLLPHLLRARARGKNKYGDHDDLPLIKELMEFMNTYFPEGSLEFFWRYPPMGIIKTVAQGWLDESPTVEGTPSDGIDFEHWCALQLEAMGWISIVSKASGDQGVDVVATKAQHIVAIQCKRYTSSVGNKAVQEVFAGMRHYGGNAAAVVATGGFTRSAIELARNTGVHLIDADNISAFDEFIIGKSRY